MAILSPLHVVEDAVRMYGKKFKENQLLVIGRLSLTGMTHQKTKYKKIHYFLRGRPKNSRYADYEGDLLFRMMILLG